MQTNRAIILDKTHGGLFIYSHILQQFYPEGTVLHLSGKQCKPARNPFLGGFDTLNIFNSDGVFLFTDAVDQDFHGDPFDFANRLYKKGEEELLQKLVEELHLNNCFKYTSIPDKKALDQSILVTQETKIILPKFSFFNRPVSNIIPSKDINLVELYQLIKSNLFESNTNRLREINDRPEARKFKVRSFDYATFSGIFSNRCDESLKQHSGLITLDFDHLNSVSDLKAKLLQDEYFETELMFISPSGDGLKWIIAIDLKEYSHQQWFQALAAYIKATYKFEIDKTGKDISRACFLPYDPNIYINPKYLQP